MPALIRLQGVGRRTASGSEILSDICLSVARGEFVSVVGPSGCGKSSLLRLIAGLDDVTSGSIDRDLGIEVGYVFQDATLMPWASVFDNVWLPLRLRGVSRHEARPRVLAWLDRVGLAARSSARPSQLSGGMRMRVSLARALVTEPPLLLLDEPFAALDELTRLQLNDDLLRLWQEQRCTVLFVTHSVYEAVALSQRVVVMKAQPGRIAQEIAIDIVPGERASFRSTAAYAALCARVTGALARAPDATSAQ